MNRSSFVLSFVIAASLAATITGCSVECRDGYCDGVDVADGGMPPSDAAFSECRPGVDRRPENQPGCVSGSTERVCGPDGRFASGPIVERPGCSCGTGCGSTPPDAGTPPPVDSGTPPPPVDSGTPAPTGLCTYHVVVTTPAGDPARTVAISQWEDWDAVITPPACTRRDEVTPAGTIVRHECDLVLRCDHPAAFNAEFTFAAPSGTRRQLVIYSCYQDSRPSPFDLFGTMTVTRNGTPVTVTPIDNGSSAAVSGAGCNLWVTDTTCPARMRLSGGICTF